LSIRHHTGFHYTKEVFASFNEARVTPLTTDTQIVLDSRLAVSPEARLFRYWDYWGTAVHAFDLHKPHSELAVVADSVVETSPAAGSVPDATWDEVTGPEPADKFAELLEATRYVPHDERLAAVAAEVQGSLSPAAAARAAMEWVQGTLSYERGATEVSTSALEAWSAGRGVCQDFAHLSLGVLRAMGIPARYVSGYLHPQPDAGIGVEVTGESHAWIEAWTGGWWPYDPTNGIPAGERHVIVGRARDYADVAPLKGIFQGGPAQMLAVRVELTRLG
jgi:transglutaminase-like putative cysteine protease